MSNKENINKESSNSQSLYQLNQTSLPLKNQIYIIEDLLDESEESQRLLSLGFTKDTKIKVTKQGNPLVVKIRESYFSLSPSSAEKLLLK